jgi:hypothetical protein
MMILTIQTLIAIGQVFEVRALGVARQYGNGTDIWSGFFQYDGTNAEFIVNEICKIPAAMGIYLTLNPVAEGLLALSFNRMSISKASTGDRDILKRLFMFVDIDPCRKAGTSATDAQVQLAQLLAQQVHQYLEGEGWGKGIVAFSGNGFHLIYPIDLPADDAGVVKGCLESLAQRFDTPQVKVDTAVHNPARIVRFYGTVARKGDEVPQLQIHHRLSQIISVPTV